MSAACVYRAFDGDGALLYVGCTGDFTTRVDQHRTTKAWWVDVSTVTVEHHIDRDAAFVAERAAIDAERPRYNVPASNAAFRAGLTRKRNRDLAHAEGRSCNDCGQCNPARWDHVRGPRAAVA